MEIKACWEDLHKFREEQLPKKAIMEIKALLKDMQI